MRPEGTGGMPTRALAALLAILVVAFCLGRTPPLDAEAGHCPGVNGSSEAACGPGPTGVGIPPLAAASTELADGVAGAGREALAPASPERLVADPSPPRPAPRAPPVPPA